MAVGLPTRAVPLRRWIPWVLMVSMAAMGPMEAWGDMINGSAEFDAYLSRSKSRDASGAVTGDSRGTDLMHKYNLSLDTSPFPLLKLSAGSSFLQDFNVLHEGETTSRTRSTTLSPYVDLFLNNTLFQGALGYSRNENWESGTQQQTPGMVNEEYHATFGWRPTGLPDLAVRVSHSNTFDADKLTQDMTTNMATVGSQYGYKTYKFGYQFTGTDTTDNLHGTENLSLLNNGSMSYSDQFFNQRVSVYSHYNANYLQATTKAGNGGLVDTFRIPDSGFSILSTDDPAIGRSDENSTNNALINGDLANSAGINVGSVPPPANPANKWSFGANFSEMTELNKINVWVKAERHLPQAIADGFIWQVWVRNSNTENWTEIDQNGTPNSAIPVPAVLDPFQNCFTLNLNTSVKAKYIKVVVNSLDTTNPAVQRGLVGFDHPDQIYVMEMQVLFTQPAAQVEGTKSRWSQSFNMDVRTRLLDSPSLYHSLSVSLSDTSGGELSYVVDNNLILDRRLNRIFTVGASAGREDISSGGQKTSAYLYSASVKATPLEGLNNTLVYSGRVDQSVRGTSSSNSLFLTNTAQPYRGIAFNLSGGYSQSTNLTGQQATNLSLVGGATIAPRQDLNFNVSYNRSLTTVSGGGIVSGAAADSGSQSGVVSATYRPFTNLYLFASLGVQQAQGRKTQYLQNYGGTWSPFPDGTLQFNMAYNESVNSVNDEKNTSVTPTLSWKVAPRAMLSLSYSLLKTDSLIASTQSTYLSTVLRLSF